MDDLSGLDWSSSNATNKSNPAPANPSSSFYPALRPSPSPFASGRNTPLSAQGSGSSAFKPPAAKPAQDSFSNLVNFGPSKPAANLSLREQQERLEAEKRKKEEEKRKQSRSHYGDGQFFDALAQKQAPTSRTASPAVPSPLGGAIGAQNGNKDVADEDLFAAFKAETRVDNASHYPPPAHPLPASGKASPANAPGIDLTNPSSWNKPATSNGGGFGDDDDDPFGLSQLKPKAPASSAMISSEEDDDLLGDLAKPVGEVRRNTAAPPPEPGKPIEDSDSESADEQPPRLDDPFDQAVAKLVDYGFTPENARRGLTESGAGLNVQAAANWLLDDAHRQAKEKAKGRGGQTDRTRHEEERSSSRPRNASPAWQVEPPSRSGNRSPAVGDGDFSKTAAAVGSNFLKTANSLWKTGQKKVQKAVAEFQQDGGDTSQPKWMRAAQQDQIVREREKKQVEVTGEAMMLESDARPGRKQDRPSGEARSRSSNTSREQSPALSATAAGRYPIPKWQQASLPAALDPRTRLSKQAVEEQASQAYVSPARRRKAAPQPEQHVEQEPEPDLLLGSGAPSRPKPPLPQRPSQSPAAAVSARPPPSRPKPSRPARQIPPISAAALQTSTQHRLDGTAHFKRGDYAAAHTSYSSSLAAVPQTHPLAILLLCNRALTALKTGEPRQAVDDADNALALIGPSKGEGESVELGGADNEKRDMRDLYGKALTRKAEALEQMEKWADASTVWQTCVESGVGGPTAIAGRQRCQKALAPKPAAKPTPRPAAPVAARPRARPPAATPGKSSSSDAVERLRAANKAAEREGDEKFALVDQVDARIAAWRDGKRDNLRALLGSMDQVLWEGSGWKKVGLHELVMANKVKVVYMKAIAKTHPDKLPQDANTEIRMIAGTVFSTLNESWDKFKAENGL